MAQVAELHGREETIGRRIVQSFAPAVTLDLGACPVCMNGKLLIIRSRRTKKRFVGCSNYAHGCMASAPLPQRGELRASKACPSCRWPVVVLGGRKPAWTFCVNPNCPSKEKKG